MTRIGVHLIFGKQPEPFLEAALRSVEWADYVCAVNTDPDEGPAQQNEAVLHRTVPREKLRLHRLRMSTMDFAQARNECLALADEGDWVLILDSDDVHYPEFEGIARQAVALNHDMVTAHFWHLIGYKDLWGQEPHREMLFQKTADTHFDKSVHEALVHPRERPFLVPEYHYVHYGYIKPPREIFRRWVLYSELEGDPDHYAGRDPDDALAGWLDNTQPFWRDHPPTVQELLEDYPSAPKSARALGETPCNVGLVLLTWNDAENLETCLKSLTTTRQPFELVVVDNGSTDGTMDTLAAASAPYPEGVVNYPTMVWRRPGLSLAAALNVGFSYFAQRPEIDYIGWIHPDMVFERDTWLECLRHALDTHPDIAKVGAWEMNAPRGDRPWAGNSQCYLVRKTALRQAGLFDERFQACGGYEDWEHNHRLLKVGKIMIWPDAAVRHNAMGTRRHHDNVEAARHNAGLYEQLTGRAHAPV